MCRKSLPPPPPARARQHQLSLELTTESSSTGPWKKFGVYLTSVADFSPAKVLVGAAGAVPVGGLSAARDANIPRVATPHLFLLHSSLQLHLLAVQAVRHHQALLH